MLITNSKAEEMYENLKSVLNRADIIGYAAALNSKRLENIVDPYFITRNALISQYGEPELDENGKKTGRSLVRFDNPNFDQFKMELERISSIEHEVDIFKINSEDVINKLTGNEILNIIWMFEDL